jgi:cytochrome c peroxidase
MKYIYVLFVVGIVSLSTISIETPTTAAELGEKLFFDPVLSLDTTISCASCHIPAFAFADTTQFSQGVNGQVGTRNTPSSMNMLMRERFFFDGRAATLQEQVTQPIHNPIEMALPITNAVQRLKNSTYNQWFQAIYGAEVDFDKWMAGDSLAMTPNQINGRTIFMEKAKCFDCHFSPDFTGDEFRNIGLYNGSDTLNDVGRFEMTKDSTDLGRFKVPGLRNIAVTAPYMHNGMFQTLEEVVEYYDNPRQFVSSPHNIDTLLQEPLGLTAEEKADIVDFLEALTDEQFVNNKNSIKD